MQWIMSLKGQLPLALFVLLFAVPSVAFAGSAVTEQKTDKQLIYQQLQERLTTAKSETIELKSYLQNAISNVQVLETNLETLKEQQVELNANLRNCNNSLIHLQTENEELRDLLSRQQVELFAAKKKQKVALVVGVTVGAVLVVGAGVTVGALAMR